MNIVFEEDEDLLLAELQSAMQNEKENIVEDELPEDLSVEDTGQDDLQLLEEEIAKALDNDYNDRVEHLTICVEKDGSISYKSGTRKNIDEARFLTEQEKKKYTEENINLIHHMAHKFYSNHSSLEEYEEFYGEATLGFTKALNTYDFGGTIPFYSYACFCMDNALRTYCQKLQKVTNPDIALSFDDDINGDADMGKIGDIYVDENQESLEDSVERKLEQKSLEESFSKISDYLTPMQTYIVSTYYGVNGCEKQNKNQICKTLHIPMKKVNEELEEALNILRETFNFVI